MPTIIKEDGFRIVIWPNDHLPPHVHVFKGNAEVKIELVEPKVFSVEGKIPYLRYARSIPQSGGYANESITILF